MLKRDLERAGVKSREWERMAEDGSRWRRLDERAEHIKRCAPPRKGPKEMKKKRKNSCQRLAKEYTYWEQRGMGVEWQVSQPPISHLFWGQTSEPSLKPHIPPPANPTSHQF